MWRKLKMMIQEKTGFLEPLKWPPANGRKNFG